MHTHHCTLVAINTLQFLPPQDEGGRIVMRKAGGTEEEGDGAFDDMQSDDGTSAFLCQGTKFTKKSLVDPLEGKRDPKGGEMVSWFMIFIMFLISCQVT